VVFFSISGKLSCVIEKLASPQVVIAFDFAQGVRATTVFIFI
jgi:hypothetical protein